jgi:SPP1 gp7 family putative phage head morphogenesis protein
MDARGGPGPVTLAAPTYGNPDPELVKETERLILFSYLVGMDHATTALDLADAATEFEAVQFSEALAFMKARVPLTKLEWNQLEEQVRFRAFTVAALSEPDAIERVRRQAIAALEQGRPMAEFWEAAKLEDAAGIGQSPWYWETVYRTNTQTAYNAGRAAEFTRNQPEYLEFVGIEDSRQTSICSERSGIILPATHPFWSSNWPPLHFNCRSTVRALYREEVEALREEDPDWQHSSEAELPGGTSATGFGGNPIQSGSFWKMTPAMKERAEKYGIMPEIEKLVAALHVPVETIVSAPDLAIVDGKKVLVESIQKRIATGFKTEQDAVDVGAMILDDAIKNQKQGQDPLAGIWGTLRSIRPFADQKNMHVYAKGSSVKGRNLLAKAQESFPRSWVVLSEKASASQAVTIRLSTDRAHYIPGWAKFRINNSLPTVSHELAHRMEEVVPSIRDLEKQFYERRTKGEAPRTLRSLTGISGYRPQEIARKDKFLDPYMGRDYNGIAYEILSMGIESLVGGKYNIVKDDPDYASFIIGLLAGL